MLVEIANWEDPDQTASSVSVPFPMLSSFEA